MKRSLTVLAFFAVGCIVGRFLSIENIPLELDISRYILYLLMFQVGLSIGSDKNIQHILKTLRPKHLLVPLATITGTLTFSLIAALFITKWSLPDCLAIGSGFGYYSLSSILITELKTASYGLHLATELGTIALITNIIRELITLLCTPLLAKHFTPLAPICAGGATTMDTTLPVITVYVSQDLIFIAILHGILIDTSVPILVSFFCSL